MRLVYCCNNPRKPSGGVYVIYRHVIELNRMGFKAAILHSKTGYTYQWVSDRPALLKDRDLKQDDYFIIPEIQAAKLAPIFVSHSLPYAIFVQNGYYLSQCSRLFSEKDIDFAYQNAHLILSISEDTSHILMLNYPQLSNRILRLYCSIDVTQFHPNDRKENLICYMPRKNYQHAKALIFSLKKKIPSHWRIISIEDVSRVNVAETLRKSRIFLSFSDLEGLGLPPIEAALSGNYVIGYYGNGGLEYWHVPNFESVSVGDISGFIEKIQRRVAMLDQSILLDELKPGIFKLQNEYSLENEKKHLSHLVKQIEQTKLTNFEKTDHSLSIKLQKRRGLARLFW